LLVDSHCHLNYLEDPERCLADARGLGVSRVLCITVDAGHVHQVLNLAERHPDVWASIGQHPQAADDGPTDWIESLLAHPRVVAVGETGLDYHQVSSDEIRGVQRRCFEQQLELAARHDLPIVIHTRSAELDTLSLLKAFPQVRGVLHCFTESWEMARQALDLGYFVSISGIVTFKNAANVRDVAVRIPQDRLLVETDAPWLTPAPHRGKPNEPAFVRHTAEFLAELRAVSFETLAEATTNNFLKLFDRVVGSGAAEHQ